MVTMTVPAPARANIKKVRWGAARKMFYGWLLTLPAAAVFGGIAAAIALREMDRSHDHQLECGATRLAEAPSRRHSGRGRVPRLCLQLWH